VMAYAESVAEKFLDAGIDVWLMTELSKIGQNQSQHQHQQHNANRSARWIKPEHLVSIITSSKSDSLIVLGDRNMKNETCQERKSGKLVEVALEESIESLLQYWANLTGLRYFKPVHNVYVNGNQNVTDEDLFNSVRELTGSCGHAVNRIERIREITSELEDWKKYTQKIAAAASNTSAANVKLTETKEFAFSEQDQMQVAQLTRNQNAAIKFDTELQEAKEIVSRLRIFDQEDPRQENDSFIIDLGLGRGVDVSMYETLYGPGHPKVVDKVVTDSLLTWGPVSVSVKTALLKVLTSFAEKLCELGDSMTTIADFVGGVSLWSEYRKEVERNEKLKSLRRIGSINSMKQIGQSYANAAGVTNGTSIQGENTTGEEQTLCAMGFELAKVRLALKKSEHNVENALNLLLLGSFDDVADNKDEDEGWSMTGQAGKLQRQKKKQEQERRERIRSQRQKQQKQMRESAKKHEQEKQQAVRRQQMHQHRQSNQSPKQPQPTNRTYNGNSAALNASRAKSQPLQQYNSVNYKGHSMQQQQRVQYNQVVASESSMENNSMAKEAPGSDISVLKNERFAVGEQHSESTLPAWNTTNIGYGMKTSENKHPSTSNAAFATSAGIPGVGSGAWQQQLPQHKKNVNTNAHSDPFGVKIKQDDAKNISNSFLLPSFLPMAEKDPNASQPNMAFPSVPPLGAWLQPPVQKETLSATHARSHSNSLDEMVDFANTSFLKAGAQEFVPMGSRQSSEMPEFVPRTEEPEFLPMNTKQSSGMPLPQNQWSNGTGSMNTQHGEFQQPASGYADFGQMSLFGGRGAYSYHQQHQPNANAGFGADQQSVWDQSQQQQQYVGSSYQSMSENPNLGSGDAGFSSDAGNNRDIRVAFQSGTVNYFKYQDDANRLYNM